MLAGGCRALQSLKGALHGADHHCAYLGLHAVAGFQHTDLFKGDPVSLFLVAVVDLQAIGRHRNQVMRRRPRWCVHESFIDRRRNHPANIARGVCDGLFATRLGRYDLQLAAAGLGGGVDARLFHFACHKYLVFVLGVGMSHDLLFKAVAGRFEGLAFILDTSSRECGKELPGRLQG